MAAAAGLPDIPSNMGRGLRPFVQAYEARRSAGGSDEESFRSAFLEPTRAQFDLHNRVLVDVLLDGKVPLPRVRRECERLGGRVTAIVGWYRHGLFTAWLPVRGVEQLAAEPGVSAVHLSIRPRLSIGAATSQGDVVLKTNLVNSSGYLGAGITVGVLSDSYNDDQTDTDDPGWTTPADDVKSGDLPGTGNPNGYTTPVDVIEDGSDPSADTDEGRAMLQIVHDVAPAAHLAFCTDGATDAEMVANIPKLMSAGCKVICDDVTYLDEPMFSDGVIAQAVNSAAASGVAYFAAIGNEGNSGYQGVFSPVSQAAGRADAAAQGVSLSSIPTSETNAIYEWHAFATSTNGTPIVVQNITTGFGSTALVFQWDDPDDVTVNAVNQITTDYDILVFNSSGTYQSKYSGIENNINTNEPIEIPSFDLAQNTKYKICIVLTNRVNGSNPRMASHLRYVAFGDTVITGDYISLNNPSAFGHACAAGCAGVAAYVYDDAPDPANSNHTYTPLVEGFSSNGPVSIYFDSAGNRLATPVVRKQPLFAAADAVDTTFFPPNSTSPNPNDYDNDGFPNFAGTSAATPHAAGIAALLMNAAAVNNLGTLSPQEIQSLMIASVQGSIDEDPVFISSTSGPVSITDFGDNDIFFNTFKISFTGTAGQQLSKVVINLSPASMHFDTNTNGNGESFSIDSTSGSPAPTASAPAFSGGTSGADSMSISFTNFKPGDSYSFSVGFDFDDTSMYGYDADELQNATFSATVSGVASPYTGTFSNQYGRYYNYKAGFGLLNAQAAVNMLLGQ